MAVDTLSISSETLRRWRDDYDYTSALSPSPSGKAGPGQLPDVHMPEPAHDTDNVFGDFFQWLGTVPQVVWIVLLVLLLALAAYFVLKRVDWHKRRKKVKEDGDEESINAGTEDIYEIDDYADSIRRAAAQGEWAMAVRLVYLASLRHLDEAGRIQWKLYKAPMEYVEESGAEALRRLTWMYLAVRFGHYPADEPLYQEAVRLSADIEKGGAHE